MISDSGNDVHRDLFQDDSGRLHAAWVSRSGTSDQLRYRFSDNGRNFSDAAVLAAGAANSIWNVSLSAADDGGGFAVYSSTFSGNGNVSLAPLGTTDKRNLIDVSIAGMDVTQGIQKRTFATRSSDPARPASFSYNGVNLAETGHTVVRVYANSRRPFAGPVPAMTLFGYRDGKQLGGGALLPDAVPTTLQTGGGNVITDAEKVSSTLVYTFTPPWQWSQGNVSFRAEINPPGLPPAIAECRLCHNDNTFVVSDIHFRKTTRVRVLPVAVTVNGVNPNGFPDPEPLFRGARATTPLPFDLPGYMGTLDMSDIANATSVKVEKCFLGIWPCSTSSHAISQSERLAFALDRLDNWASDHSSSVYPIGVFRDATTLGGVTNGGAQLFGGSQPRSIVRDSRPLTSIAHEIGHGLGRVHAGLTCGSNSNGQVGESWPPNDDGALDGIGLDTSKPPPYAVLDPAAANAPSVFFDLMSYCANTNEAATAANKPDAWVSIRNWERDLAVNAPKQAADAAAKASRPAVTGRVAAANPAAARTLRAVAMVPVQGDPSVINVAPDDGPPTPIDPAGRYQLIARDAKGKALASAGAVAQLEHVENGPPVVMVSGRVPAAGAVAVDVVQDGTVVSQQLASKFTPKVKFLSPGRGAQVGKRGTVDVRWRTTDPDRGAKLTSIIQYSANDGASFTTVSITPSNGSVRLPVRLFPASRRARIRIRVQDGFHETLATSARFVSLGAPPLVRIVTPATGTSVQAGAGLTLAGEAFDDAGRALTGRALTWLVGKRVIARGGLASAPGLAPGARTIVLRATDHAGRTSSRSIVVRVLPGRPLFTVLNAPARLSRKAKRIVLTVAASFESRLRVGNTKAMVDRTPRRVFVAIKPGGSLLVLDVSLSSSGGVSHQTILIPRG
jgi:hypothetical protein